MDRSERMAWKLELELMDKAADEMEKGNGHKALPLLNEVLSVNPMHLFAYKCRGIIYAGLKNYQKAIEDFKRAIDISLNDSNVDDSFTLEIYYYLGNVHESIYFAKEFLESVEYLAQAIKIYTKILQIHPKCIPARYRRGNLYYYIGTNADRPDELLRLAVEDLNFILENEPENMDTTMKMDTVRTWNLARMMLGEGDLSWLEEDSDIYPRGM
ncbi:tetratricopeptide repeat protein [Microcoleus sp. T3B2]|uniref:tetratricopeptide repeat protein n=2 Tax=unclassified Microcoleus TaxID=2642155 RepID=UPI002FD55FB5